MIELRTKIAITVCYSRGKHEHIEAKRSQEPGEQAVEFITKSTAMIADDLAEQRFVIKNYWLARMDRQIFERYIPELSNLKIAAA